MADDWSTGMIQWAMEGKKKTTTFPPTFFTNQNCKANLLRPWGFSQHVPLRRPGHHRLAQKGHKGLQVDPRTSRAPDGRRRGRRWCSWRNHRALVKEPKQGRSEGHSEILRRGLLLKSSHNFWRCCSPMCLSLFVWCFFVGCWWVSVDVNGLWCAY